VQSVVVRCAGAGEVPCNNAPGYLCRRRGVWCAALCFSCAWASVSLRASLWGLVMLRWPARWHAAQLMCIVHDTASGHYNVWHQTPQHLASVPQQQSAQSIRPSPCATGLQAACTQRGLPAARQLVPGRPWHQAALACPAQQATGVGWYAGDIGTSPLYVYSTTFYPSDGAPKPDTDSVLGATSLVIWVLTWLLVRP